MRTPLVLAGCLAATPLFAADLPVLTILTYDSFTSDWGPGPAVEAAFEEVCGCDLVFETGGDGAALLARLRLEGDSTDIDVVLGLDTNLTAAALATGLFAEHGVEVPPLDLPIAWEDTTFLPFDWGYFAFVHDTALTPPTDFRALADSDVTLVIEDPRSSTPGLGLLMWVKAAYGDEAEAIWDGLADNIVTVTQGWSEAYGLFLEGEADMVLSYTTSPAYHILAEEDHSKAAAIMDEGHYMQVEVAGRVAGSHQEGLARDFLAFMLTEPFQAVIPQTNWMYPAVLPEGGLPAAFDPPIPAGKALLMAPEAAQAARDPALAEWLSALSR